MTKNGRVRLCKLIVIRSMMHDINETRKIIYDGRRHFSITAKCIYIKRKVNQNSQSLPLYTINLNIFCTLNESKNIIN